MHRAALQTGAPGSVHANRTNYGLHKTTYQVDEVGGKVIYKPEIVVSFGLILSSPGFREEVRSRGET